MTNQIKFAFSCLILIFMAHLGTAQVSVKMGYGIRFLKEEPQHIFRTLRTRSPWLNMEDKAFKNLQGVMLGLRYHNEHFAAEADFNYSFWNVTGSGINPDLNRDERKKISWLDSSIGFGVEALFGKIGLGTTIHRNIFTQKVNSSIDGTFQNRSNYMSEKVFLGIYIPGSKHTTLAFRPYYEFPFGKLNMYFTDAKLNPERAATLEKKDYDYTPSAFGIQFLFLNGG